MIDTPIQPDVIQTVNNPPLVPVPVSFTDGLTAMVAPLVAPLVQDAATSAATSAVQPVQASVDAKHAESLAAIGALQTGMNLLVDEIAANKAAIEAAVGRVGAAVVKNVEEDPWTQRGIVAAFLLAGLIILVAALLGNSTANRWIGGVPIALGAAVLWVSNAGMSLPKLPAKHPTPAK
jgi:hypothetical protein